MSRIGNKEIEIPKGVKIEVKPSNIVSVVGPKGTLSQKVDTDISVSLADNKIRLSRPTEQKRHKALHGLYRSLLNNMVSGVTKGYTKTLELIGVGFKATSTGNNLELTIGYSHPIVFVLPPEVKLKTETPKGGNPTIFLESIDKQLIGQIAAKIRGLRPPEPYKGKGIKYQGEFIKRKAGKAAAKK